MIVPPMPPVPDQIRVIIDAVMNFFGKDDKDERDDLSREIIRAIRQAIGEKDSGARDALTKIAEERPPVSVDEDVYERTYFDFGTGIVKTSAVEGICSERDGGSWRVCIMTHAGHCYCVEVYDGAEAQEQAAVKVEQIRNRLETKLIADQIAALSGWATDHTERFGKELRRQIDETERWLEDNKGLLDSL